MKPNRKDEIGKLPHRSSRIFHMNNQWYFNTREGVDIGPFHSRNEALTNLQDFLEFIQLANKKILKSFSSALNKKEELCLAS